MQGSIATEQVDEWACQRLCLRTPGCSHFSFWKAGRFCHLQDALSLKSSTEGFISGPFQCWAYFLPGAFTQISNQTYVPEQFRCMQIGVMWEPMMDSSILVEGSRDEVVLRCQRQCAGTWGCEHFTVMFPNTCQLSGKNAAPLPAASTTMSGPAVSSCHEPGYIGHTFLKQHEEFQSQRTSHGSATSTVSVVAAVAFVSVVGAAVVLRRPSHRERDGERVAMLLTLDPNGE